MDNWEPSRWDEFKSVNPVASDGYSLHLMEWYEIDGGDEVMTDLENIVIRFDYPLKDYTEMGFRNEGGFTLYKFLECVYNGYSRIYEEEEKAVGDPGNIPGMLNRAISYGPYGIWGHVMSDLYVEQIVEDSPGHFILGMGS